MLVYKRQLPYTYLISTILLRYIDLHVQAQKNLRLFSANSSSKIAPSVATEAGLIFDFGASEKCPFRHEADHRREHRVVVWAVRPLRTAIVDRVGPNSMQK